MNIFSGKSKQPKPVVSVCIQTYQHGDYISQALDSVLEQECEFPYEILLGEDGSTDGTREICNEYAQKYPDVIRLFLNDRSNVIYIDGYPTGRWNFLNNVKHANGKYIALLSGDDYWQANDKLQQQIDMLENNDKYSMCFHDVNILHDDGSLEEFPDLSGHTEINLEDLFDQWFIPTCSMVFRNNINFPEWFTDVASGDIALHFLLAEQGKFYYLKNNMGVYRKHAGGVSSTHNHYKKAVDMSRLYHYLDLHFNRKYRDKINNAIKGEIYLHIEQPHLLEKEITKAKVDAKIKSMTRVLNHPLIKPIVLLLKKIKRDKRFGVYEEN